MYCDCTHTAVVEENSLHVTSASLLCLGSFASHTMTGLLMDKASALMSGQWRCGMAMSFSLRHAGGASLVIHCSLANAILQ